MTIQNLQETSIMMSFSALSDPRKSRNQCYSLFRYCDSCNTWSSLWCHDWVEISLWGEGNQEWLEQCGIYKNGIPSPDIFSCFFRFVDPVAFEQCFI